MSGDWQETELEFAEFDWDENKNRKNQIKHAIAFKDAAKVFFSPYLTSYQDWHDEHRYAVLGLLRGTVIFVVCTERADTCRIISARKATATEQRRYRAHFGEEPA